MYQESKHKRDPLTWLCLDEYVNPSQHLHSNVSRDCIRHDPYRQMQLRVIHLYQGDDGEYPRFLSFRWSQIIPENPDFRADDTVIQHRLMQSQQHPKDIPTPDDRNMRLPSPALPLKRVAAVNGTPATKSRSMTRHQRVCAVSYEIQ
jgi:hypothetical protein